MNEVRFKTTVHIEPLQSLHRRSERGTLKMGQIVVCFVMCHADNAEYHGITDRTTRIVHLATNHLNCLHFDVFKKALLSVMKQMSRDPTVQCLNAHV